jgi:hypothetical protein
MNKRRLHHLWTKVRWIKPWHFAALALLSAVVCVAALRANNQHMADLRNNVYSADKAGKDVQAPLKELQAYVTSHMNTSLSSGTSVYPPIQLKYTYERLTKTQQATPGSALYNEAQKHCEALNPVDFSGRNRVPCITAYVKSHTPAKAAAAPDALYKFDFVSPRWSPDLAGWSLLATVLFALLAVLSWPARQLLRDYSH